MDSASSAVELCAAAERQTQTDSEGRESEPESEAEAEAELDSDERRESDGGGSDRQSGWDGIEVSGGHWSERRDRILLSL